MFFRTALIAARAEEIDVARAQAALERAQKTLEQPHADLDPATAPDEGNGRRRDWEAAAHKQYGVL